MRDALRLSRGMSYKNAMAGLPMGGGKAVILAGPDRHKTPEMLSAFGDAIDALGGRYITAEDVGMGEADMVAIAQRTPYVTGLPATDSSAAGGDPGPFTGATPMPLDGGTAGGVAKCAGAPVGLAAPYAGGCGSGDGWCARSSCNGGN